MFISLLISQSRKLNWGLTQDNTSTTGLKIIRELLGFRHLSLLVDLATHSCAWGRNWREKGKKVALHHLCVLHILGRPWRKLEWP